MKPYNYYSSLEKENTLCLLCSSSAMELLGVGDRYGMGIKTVSCKSCGLFFTNPRPTQLAMDEFYKTKYREFYESVEKPTIEYIKKGPFQARANFVANALKPYISSSDDKRLLDVGCADGTLLKTMSERFPGLSISGLEPNPNFASFAKQYAGTSNIFTGSLKKYLDDSKPENFDVITITHVLEHMPRPVETLLHLKSLLKEQGLLYIEVPNVLDNRVKGIGAVHIAHIISFYPKTFETCIKMAGFEIVEFFLEGLPAMTPSMAAIARPSEKVAYEFNLDISRDEIEKSQKQYKKNIFGVAEEAAKSRSFSMRRIMDYIKNKFS
jgi:2-polyprenyl-3-methyl-5-hydroxy-6-metoxy-1,4-benzoquinol methylase